MKILVVEDDRLLLKGIKFNLESEGYTVDTAMNGEDGVTKAKEGKPDLILLDLMLPKLSGLNVCQKVREFSNVPVIMLTAKSDDTDKVLGFEFGADDYITKPFNIMELKVRIRAILRRAAVQEATIEKPEFLEVGDIRIDYGQHTVYTDERPVELTAKEFDLLDILMRNPGHVYSREKLLSVVWGYEYPGDVRTVDVHVRRLREKIEKNSAQPEYILTKWGVGYYFRP